MRTAVVVRRERKVRRPGLRFVASLGHNGGLRSGFACDLAPDTQRRSGHQAEQDSGRCPLSDHVRSITITLKFASDSLDLLLEGHPRQLLNRQAAEEINASLEECPSHPETPVASPRLCLEERRDQGHRLRRGLVLPQEVSVHLLLLVDRARRRYDLLRRAVAVDDEPAGRVERERSRRDDIDHHRLSPAIGGRLLTA